MGPKRQSRAAAAAGENTNQETQNVDENWGETPTRTRRIVEEWFEKLDPGVQQEYKYRVVLDGTVIDAFNQREASAALEPREGDDTADYLMRASNYLAEYWRKGGKRTLSQVMGGDRTFYRTVALILGNNDPKKVDYKDIMEIPGMILCGAIKAYFMSETTASRVDIEEITKSLRLISFEATANLVTASQRFINVIEKQENKLLAFHGNNEKTLVEFLTARVDKVSLRDHIKHKKVERLKDFIQELQSICYDWSQAYIVVLSRERGKIEGPTLGKRKSDSNQTISAHKTSKEKMDNRAQGDDSKVIQPEEGKRVIYCLNCYMRNSHTRDKCNKIWDKLSKPQQDFMKKKVAEVKKSKQYLVDMAHNAKLKQSRTPS